MEFLKSKQRVADHGEVFAPPEIVHGMMELVRTESERIDARFLEPACGSGNFSSSGAGAQAVDRRRALREERLREEAPSLACPSSTSATPPHGNNPRRINGQHH